MAILELNNAARRMKLFLSSGQCHRSLVSSGRDFPPITRGPFTGHKRIVERLWREFFVDPSQWWDHRSGKVNPRYPDFKHRKRKESLWLNDKSNPPWVAAELAAMAPGALQSNTFSWNKRLSRYVKAGEYEKTIELFHQMQQEGMNPDKFTFVPVLNACSNLRALADGRCIHTHIVKSGCESDIYVDNCLVDMYAKCGSIEDARTVFNSMPMRNVVTWNSMILGYVKCGQGQKALELSRLMQGEGLEPDTVTFVGMLNACASVLALDEGRCFHEQIIQKGFENDVFVASSLVDMYAKCGNIDDARRVFNNMPTRNVVAWSAMILGHVKCGEGHRALELYRQMHEEGVKANAVSFVGVLNACASVAALAEGRHVHQQIIQRNFESNVFVGSSLVDMYTKCGSIEDAWKVFKKMPKRDVVAWSAMILGFVKSGQGQKALELYKRMIKERVEPNSVSFVGGLNACASLAALEEGQLVHQNIIERGYESDVFVRNSLVDMYAKCGDIENAGRVFNQMPIRDVVAWSAMILGCVKCGQAQKALELYRQMCEDKVEPNHVSFVGVLNACASIAALEEGRCVHKHIIERCYDSDLFVGNGLVDMYAKCGSIEDAQAVFNKMPIHDVVSWNTMLGGYAMHGYAKEGLAHFEQMCEAVQMDGVTFVSLLSACSHVGLVDEGVHYFESMISVYGITPKVEHYACLVDLLGRAGRLHEAEDLIKAMSCEPNVGVWMSLLGACRVHGYVEMGEHIAK